MKRKGGLLGRQNIEKDAGKLRTLITLAGVPSSATDHGTLTGLGDDDHSQYVHLSAGRTITGQHQFAPASAQAPFTLGANAQNQQVTGFLAEFAAKLNRTVTAGSGLTGGGTLTGDITLNVGAGNGLTVAADLVSLDTPGTLTVSGGNVATGNHTHAITNSSNPGAAATILASNASGYLQLVRLGLGVAPSFPLHVQHTTEQLRLAYDGSNFASFTVDSGGNLSVVPSGDFIFNPGGNDVHPNVNYDLNLGLLNKKWLTLHAAELWVETLVAQNTIATIGGRILVGPTTTLITDLAPATTQIEVKHNQMASGDRVYMEADGKVEFMAVTSGPTTITGGYRYNVTRNLDGSGANQWYAGDAVFNTGTTGDGFIDLYSIQGVVSGGAGPTIVGNVRLSSTYNDIEERWAIGNLNGLYDYGANTYGMAAGDPDTAWVGVDETNGIRLMRGSVKKVGIQPDGDLFIGENTAAAATTFLSIFTNAQTYNSESVSAGDVLLGDNSSSKANIFWDKSAGRLNFRGGTSTEAYIDTNGNVAAGGGNVWMNSDGLNLDMPDQAAVDTSAAVRFMQGSSLMAHVASHRYTVVSDEEDLMKFTIASGANKGQGFYFYGAGSLIATIGNINAGLSVLGDWNGIVAHTGNVRADSGVLSSSGGVLVGGLMSGQMTVGMTLNQGGSDNEIIALQSSDVTHGMTDVADTDTFMAAKKHTAVSGGVKLEGFTEATVGLQLTGSGVTDDTGKATTADGYVQAVAWKKSGTGIAAPGANANLFVVKSGSNTRLILDQEGDLHLDASSNPNAYDAYNDAQLCRAIDLVLAPERVIRSQFDEWLQYGREELAVAGLVTFNEDGRHFVNMSQLQRLHNGAIWQLHQEVERLKAALEALGGPKELSA